MLKFIFVLALSISVRLTFPPGLWCTESYRVTGFQRDFQYQWVTLDGNNINSYFQNTGIFDKDFRSVNTPGYEWPKGSGKHLSFTSGLSIGAYINNNLGMVCASYAGEYTPGIVQNGVPVSGNKFKIYKVYLYDNCYSSPDYANWKLMVPYGAPYDDVNNNGVYDDCIDKPGVKDAIQTIFICLTDAFPQNRNAGEGFGGGVWEPLLYADLRFTAWCYNFEDYLRDIQYIRYDIINSGSSRWDSTYFSFFNDSDLGDGIDDRLGCDTLLDMGFTYNGDNMDGDGFGVSYGAAPPAFGTSFIRSAVNKGVQPYDTLGMTSFVPIGRNSSSPPCEGEANAEPYGAYNYMAGFKKDRSPWINPYITEGSQKTKFVFSGAPYQDSVVQNCNGDSTGKSFMSFPGDKKFLMNTGAKDLTVLPGDTQTVVLARVVQRGSDNLHSIVKLKERTRFAKKFYDIVFAPDTNTIVPTPIIPVSYRLAQNYPNPFNPATTIEFDVIIKFNVELRVYDLMGKEISTLVNRELEPGSYKINFDASGLPSGVYYYKIRSGYFEEAKKMVVIR